ncbi:Glucose dehydrogenase [FAD, quinone] [Lucilia cuprina]|uniref:Glucose dehydrogenase [FAD, quinone] n=1 Tax=Lucilia cuprina TaxID=7375 RepID=A0A0L0CD95_LUCCU|nr:quinone, Glucose dehydrogenase FAD [Lucilia cuprina]KNC29439.1 Glucose dehydrogenase [FAD, quinone] [Lucilia cuprina]
MSHLKNIAIISFLSIVSLSWGQNFVDLARDLETSLLNTRLPDTQIFLPEYDFIIIGAGSGGCVVANRLSEIQNATVLLLEAGDQETFISDVPLTAALTQMTRYNWGYKSDPTPNACQGLKNGVCNWPKGRGVGGTSLINFMLYTRGHRKDYDNWSKLGNKGWSYDEVLPYFKKSEHIEIEELRKSKYHGTKGPLNVCYTDYKSKLLKAFLKSSHEMGYNITDPNGEHMLGFSRSQATLQNGRRCSSGKAFIKPIIHRKNLHLSMKSRVTKIVIEPSKQSKKLKARAVEFIKNRQRFVVRAKKEIILSAGSIASPQLLMLSGIGPKENLKQHNITVLKDLKVGYNLQDHITLNGLVFSINDSTVNDRRLMNPTDILQYILQGKGPYTIPGGAEAFAFVRTPSSAFDKDYSDMEIVLGAGSLSGDHMGSMRDLLGISDEFYQTVYRGLHDKETFGLVPVLLRPKSKGRISLRSANPFHWPKMEPNFMQDPDDVRAMIEGVKLILKLTETKAMRRIGTQFNRNPFLGCEHLPFSSDDYWKCCLRLYGSSLQHQSGTCKMGPPSDPEAVVDPLLRVYGTENLRVADASIMPNIPAGHTNAIVIMIAEKAADMIKNSWRMKTN